MQVNCNLLYTGLNMKRFKYQISHKGDQKETWVCENCKKANNELILKGIWKLVDRKNDARIKCGICGNKVAADE